MSGASLKLVDLSMAFPDAQAGSVTVLQLPSWELLGGQEVGIRGPSGAGKSTLLNLISGLMVPTTGAVWWDGCEISKLTEPERDRWRRQNVGFIFQEFHLIPELSALENVLLPLRFDHWRCPPRKRHYGLELLDRFGIPRPRQLAATLSRGQQQRVAVARALINQPPILLADEPTASLDRQSADSVTDLLLEVAQESHRTLIVSSHDPLLLGRLTETYLLSEGRLELV